MPDCGLLAISFGLSSSNLRCLQKQDASPFLSFQFQIQAKSELSIRAMRSVGEYKLEMSKPELQTDSLGVTLLLSSASWRGTENSKSLAHTSNRAITDYLTETKVKY